MKLINPSAKLIPQNDIWEHIAYCAKVCYASENTETKSAKEFVLSLVNKGHSSILRHGTLYFTSHNWIHPELRDLLYEIYNSPYTEKVDTADDYNRICMTTNMQVLFDNEYLRENIDFLLENCEIPSEDHIRRRSFELVTQLSTTRELNRVSPNNITEQSTRYCNYSKDKFGNEVTFCAPHWTQLVYTETSDKPLFLTSPNTYRDLTENDAYLSFNAYCESLAFAEKNYLLMIRRGIKAQDARGVLPLDVASKVIYTYSDKEWDHIIDLRYHGTTGVPHPNAKLVIGMVKDIIEETRKIEENDRY